jgi:hypothetical protein
MRRRRLLALALPALAPGCLSGLPTASGPRAPPEPDGTPGGDTGTGVSVSDIDVEPTDDDRLRVVATVRNRGGTPVDARVVVTVTVGGDETVRETTVRAPAGESATASVAFDATFDAFSADGSVSARVA